MARIRLISKEEIDEPVFAYTLSLLGWYLGATGFHTESPRFGYFEFGLNMWATAFKEARPPRKTNDQAHSSLEVLLLGFKP